MRQHKQVISLTIVLWLAVIADGRLPQQEFSNNILMSMDWNRIIEHIANGNLSQSDLHQQNRVLSGVLDMLRARASNRREQCMHISNDLAASIRSFSSRLPKETVRVLEEKREEFRRLAETAKGEATPTAEGL